jgi:hypothetical protein
VSGSLEAFNWGDLNVLMNIMSKSCRCPRLYAECQHARPVYPSGPKTFSRAGARPLRNPLLADGSHLVFNVR